MSVMFYEISGADKAHYLLHLNAILKDAEGVKSRTERERIVKEAQDMATSKMVIPVMQPCELCDWIEKPETRVTDG